MKIMIHKTRIIQAQIVIFWGKESISDDFFSSNIEVHLHKGISIEASKIFFQYPNISFVVLLIIT